MKHQRILVFDFETTGLSATDHEVIEIGALLLEKGSDKYYPVGEPLSILVKPTGLIPEKITEITGITQAMVSAEGLTQIEAFQRLYSLYDDETLLIAYNIQFDLGFLVQGFRKYIDRHFEVKNDILDVMAVYKDRHAFPHRLQNAIQTYAVTIPNSHRASDDCLATYEVLKKMQNEENDIAIYVNQIGYNKKYGISGIRLPHVTYIPQYGGYREIKRRYI